MTEAGLCLSLYSVYIHLFLYLYCATYGDATYEEICYRNGLYGEERKEKRKLKVIFTTQQVQDNPGTHEILSQKK